MFDKENEKEQLVSQAEQTEQAESIEMESVEFAGEGEAPAPERPNYVRKKRRQKTTAAVFTVLVLAAVVLANVIIYFLGQKVSTNIDLTNQKVLELSDETVDLVQGVTQDIQIYSLIPQTVEDELLSILDDILEQYQKLSPHITYQKIDTTQNPTFIQKYQQTGETLNAYSIIFESGSRFKVVDVNDTISVNRQTSQAQYLSAEQNFTSAITYVTSQEDTKIAIIQGHGEVETSIFESMLSAENYTVQGLNLATEEIPDDVKLLILASPQTDFIAEEIDKLDRFFDRGGRAQIMLDVSVTTLPRLEEYLAEWGVTMELGFVVENDTSHYLQSQLLLLPDIESTDFTETIVDNQLRVAFPQARGITISRVAGVESQNILTTSTNSFIRTDVENQEIKMADGDIPGPVTVAALLTRSTSDVAAQMLVTGGTGFLSQMFLEESGFANNDFFMNSLSYLTEQENSIYIRPKDVSPSLLAITGSQALLYGGIVLIAIPLVILLAGLFVWLRRRHL